MSRTPNAKENPAPAAIEPDAHFLADYYAHLPSEDAQMYGPEILRARALYHLAVASIRYPGQSAVGILNERDASVIAVVAEAMPYVVRSLEAELGYEDMSIRMLVYTNFHVKRDPNSHKVLNIRPGNAREGLLKDSAGVSEIWVALEIARLADEAAASVLTDRLHEVLDCVRTVYTDADAIESKVRETITSLDGFPPAAVPAKDQLRQLLLWLDAGNFVFLGYDERELTTPGGQELLVPRHGSGLGLLRRIAGDTAPHPNGFHSVGDSTVFTVSTSETRSSVLRRAFLDELFLHEYNGAGTAIGEKRFVGFFTPSAAQESVLQIPVILGRAQAVIDRLGYMPHFRQPQEVLAVLESLPRNELFQLESEALAELADAILGAEDTERMRVFLRPQNFGPFISAVVVFPRLRYSTSVLRRLEQELGQLLKATSVDFQVTLTESRVARVYFLLHMHGPASQAGVSVTTGFDVSELEGRLMLVTRTWSEELDEALRARLPAPTAARLFEQWSDAFPPNYRAVNQADTAVGDILNCESLELAGQKGESDPDVLWRVYPESGGSLTQRADARIRLYLTTPRSLTQILPILHNLGLEVLYQQPFELRHGGGRSVFLYDLGVKYPVGVDPVASSGLLADAFAAALRGDVESDRFDGLIIREGISWRQASILRSYAKYLQQLGTTVSYGFVADTFLGYARATQALLALFHTKFDPSSDVSSRFGATAAATAELQAAIDEIPVLEADRLFRTFMAMVDATVRTNYFMNKPHLSFKLNPGAIANAPLPRPMCEIWVYSPRVEGVHLRFGRLARGGLRWSERSEDFRTEILGLVKAQNVKNSVIVPTGAKGGFYAKKLQDPAADQEARMAEGLECYRIFIHGLLDLTDNLVVTPQGEKVVAPVGVVRHDGDDYYLVVAADKGTATFSDAANAVAQEHGFWLGDAFASGGSVGYDHKLMGITARGAWESVKHHFNELGINPQVDDFTVIGIGDMSGDVFGNAMLLSPHIRLLAAFDHRHIFLDPAPDAAKSFGERGRLAGLPRSSWADYDPSLLSTGGGVHSRAAKVIDITEEVRLSLGLMPGTTSLQPHALIQAILRAPVDLLFNGGIGTYVKAADEHHAEVGDKANDAVRINGCDLRARTVAEGGNLGITQRGRIEAALTGVLLNTDAIDNSAGVDCSDHEVNIKILVDRVIAAGKMPASQRASFLQSLTDDVARLVLANNVDQNVLLFNDRHLVQELSPGFERLMDWLEQAADLDRNLEALPSAEQLHERLRTGKGGLTAPELAVLAALAKIELARELSASDLADDPWFTRVLQSYFPYQLSERFESALEAHPLRRQIIGTVLANDMINLGGITFAFRATEETNADAAAVARAFVVVREVYNLRWIMGALAALPPGFPAEIASEVALYIRRALDRASRWYVTHEHRDLPVADALDRIAPTFGLLLGRAQEFLRDSDREHTEDRLTRWNDVGMPRELAKRASDLLESFGLLDISLLSEKVDEPVTMIADLYYALFHRIGALGLLMRITNLPQRNRWEAMARAALRDDVYSAVADMTLYVLQTTPVPHASRATTAERIAGWERGHQEQLERIEGIFSEVTKPGQADIDSIAVAIKLLRTMVRR